MPREQQLLELVAALSVGDGDDDGAAASVALIGGGGFGKTTLARAICHDEDIQQAYSDGILWVTLGEKPGDLTSRVEDLIMILTGSARQHFSSIEAATTRLRELLQDRAILLVIDDVWNRSHLRPFMQGGGRCARLITTRDSATLPAGTLRIHVDAMESREGTALLGFGLDEVDENGDLDDRKLEGLAERLGHWPLLIDLARPLLRERIALGQSVEDSLRYLDRALDKHGMTAFDARSPETRHEAVSQTIGVSLERFDADEQERLAELSVFAEDLDVPLGAVERLWNASAGLDDFETEELCGRFFRSSLLLSFDLTQRHIRLHDVMRSFLAHRLGAPEGAHGALADAWSASPEPPDEFAWRWYPYHLRHSGRGEALRELLTSLGWLEAKLRGDGRRCLDRRLRPAAGRRGPPADAEGAAPGRPGTRRRPFAAPRAGIRSAPRGARRATLAAAERGASAVGRGGVWLNPVSPVLAQATEPLLRTFRGHDEGVTGLVVSDDGRWVASSSSDQSMFAWRLDEELAFQVLQSRTRSVLIMGRPADNRALAITPDGRELLSAHGSQLGPRGRSDLAGLRNIETGEPAWGRADRDRPPRFRTHQYGRLAHRLRRHERGGGGEHARTEPCWRRSTGASPSPCPRVAK